MSSKERRPSARLTSTTPAWIWLTLGILIGLGIAMVTGSGGYDNSSKTNAAAHDEQVEPDTDPFAQRSFDFYTLLPELEVVIPEEETKESANSKHAARSSEYTTHTGKYLLQVSSFQQLNDANNLKIRLAKLGVTAHVQSVNVNNSIWHRVRIGPVSNRKALEQLRGRLRVNGIDAMLMQAKQ